MPSMLADCLKEQVSITHTKYIVTPFWKFSAGDVSVQNLQVSTSITQAIDKGAVTGSIYQVDTELFTFCFLQAFSLKPEI